MKHRTARSVSPILFAGAILVFLLPFASVSCSGEELMTVSGIQLVTGVTVERSDFFGNQREETVFDPEPLSIVALVAGVLGFGVAFLRMRPRTIGTTVLGTTGVVALLLLYARATSEASSQAIPMAVNMELGYWLALLAFGGVAAVNGTLWLQDRESGGGETLISARASPSTGTEAIDDRRRGGTP